jgi:hypothetical protein
MPHATISCLLSLLFFRLQCDNTVAGDCEATARLRSDLAPVLSTVTANLRKNLEAAHSTSNLALMPSVSNERDAMMAVVIIGEHLEKNRSQHCHANASLTNGD